MRNKPASPPLPPMTADEDDIRIAIDRLESEAQTHEDRRDDGEQDMPVAHQAVAKGE